MISYFKSLKSDKTKLVIFLLSLWLIISLIAIGWYLINQGRLGLFWQGYGMAVEDLINRAEDEGCDPFPVFMEDRQVYLINVACLGDEMPEFEMPEMTEDDIWIEEE